MGISTVRVIVLGLTALVGASSAAAQEAVDRFWGRTIASVRFEVEGRPDHTPALAGEVDTKAGDTLRPETVRASVVKLYLVGQFDDVEVSATEAGTGVDLLYALVPRHPVDRVDFRALAGASTGLPAATLDRLLRQQFGGLPTVARSAAAIAVVERALKDEGYLLPVVRISVEITHQPDRATLVFTIGAGAQARLGTVAIHVVGHAPLTEATILERTGAVRGAPFVPRAINAALDGLVDDLRGRGYYEAASKAPETDVSPDGSVVNLVLDVSTGPLVRIVFANPKDFPGGTVEDLVPFQRMRSIDDDLIDDSERRIADLLRQDGYWHAAVLHSRTDGADATIVTFTVQRGLRYQMDAADVVDNAHLPAAEILALLPAPTTAFFDQSRIDLWRGRVLAAYRRVGFAFSDVKYDLADTTGSERAQGIGHVHVRLVVTEGPETRVAGIVVHNAKAIPEADLRAKMISRQDAPYVRANMDTDQGALETLYRDRGFHVATVAILPVFSEDHTTVTLTVELNEGPQLILDRIDVVGNRGVSESLIRQQMAVRIGQPLSQADLTESQRRVISLQLFRTVAIETTPVPGSETHVALAVRVEEAPATTVGFGGGLSVQQKQRTAPDGGSVQRVEFAPRGSFDIGRRNLFGRNRQLNFSSSVSLRPKDAPGDSVNDGKGFGFGEYHVSGAYRSPQALGPRTDLVVGTTFEQAPRLTFNYHRNTLHADLQRRVGEHMSAIGRYTLEFTKVFDFGIPESDLLLVDRLFPQVRLSTLSGGLVRDMRDDVLDPSNGTFLSAETDFAPRWLGSEVGFFKTLVGATGFHQISKSPRTVLAGRAQVGVAWGFGRDVTTIDPTGQPVTQHVTDLPASQRYFAGGSTTVRGFNVDQLGTAAVLDKRGLSNGGNGVIILNGEVRTTIARDFLRRGGDLGVVGFVDAGNVFARAGDLGLNQLLGTVGFGVRWKSPIGPVRLDIGFKVNPRVIVGVQESRMGFHFSIGEAF